MKRYAIYIGGPSDCPNDPGFEHDGYLGCVPKDFNPSTGRSRTHRQHKTYSHVYACGYKYVWDGGCDAQPALHGAGTL